MLSPNSFNFHLIGDILKATLKLFAALHEVFDVEDCRKVELEQVKEFFLVFWQFIFC